MHQKSITWNRAALRVQFSFALFARLYLKAGFDPDQSRDEQGRWAGVEGNAPDTTPEASGNLVVAQYSFGTLIAQSPAISGRRQCFYQFSFGVVVVPGPSRLNCPGMVPSSAVTHGILIPGPANDR